MRLLLCLLSISLLLLTNAAQKVNAQEWLEKVYHPNTSFYEVQDGFYEYWEGRNYEKSKGWKQFKRWEYFMEGRVDKNGYLDPAKQWNTYHKYMGQQSNNKAQGSSNTSDWSFIGPASIPQSGPKPGGMGRVNCMAFHPNDTSIIFLGTPAGGLWKSEDGGTNWTGSTDFLPVLGVSDIQINPLNPNIMYIATGDANAGNTYSIGLLKSTDGGNNWFLTDLIPSNSYDFSLIYKIAMHPEDPATLLVATNMGLFKSVNGGNNWELVSEHGLFRDLKFDTNNPALVYATGYEYSGGGTFSKFYKSTDEGQSWPSLTEGGIGGFIGRMQIGLSPVVPNEVYLLSSNYIDGTFKGFYKSIDNGDNFIQIANSPDIIIGQGSYNMALAVSPIDNNKIFAAGVSMFRSDNEGSNWEETIDGPNTPGYVHVDVHDIAFMPDNPSTLFVGCDGGFYKSEDEGTTWNDLSNGLQITQFYKIGLSSDGQNVILGGTQDNGAILYKNGNWGNLVAADAMDCIIDFEEPDTMYYSTQGGAVWKSKSDGTFSSIISPNNVGIWENHSWVVPYLMHPNDPKTLLVGYQSIWKTTDRGQTWTNLSGGLLSSDKLNNIAVAPSNPDQIIYATDFDLFFKSTDGGISWSDKSLSFMTGYPKDVVVHDTDPDNIWICTSEGEVYNSTDGGENWENYSGSLPKISANTMAFQKESDSAIYLGMDIGVFYRDNNMDDWEPFMDNLPNVIVNEIEIDYCNAKIVAATFGRGLWQSNWHDGNLICANTPTLKANLQVLLEGPFDPTTSLMTTHLLNLSLLPLNQPYNTAPWFHAGSEYLPNQNAFPSNTVDWVLVEAREENDSFNVLETKAALLLSDGTIVDTDGTAGVNFSSLSAGTPYFISVKHRNHLAVISSVAIELPNNIIYDFSKSPAEVQGSDQLKEVAPNLFGLHAGDFTSNGVVTVDDFNIYAQEISFINLYVDSDCNLDRTVSTTDFNFYTPSISLIGAQQIRY